MFGIGLSEFAVIVCIVIVFVRPKDLPALFRRLGKLYAQAKRAYKEITEVKDQFVKSIEVAAAETEAEAGKGGADPAGEGEASAAPAEAVGAAPAAPELAGEGLAGDELGEAGYADGSGTADGAEPAGDSAATAGAGPADTTPAEAADPSRETPLPLK